MNIGRVLTHLKRPRSTTCNFKPLAKPCPLRVANDRLGHLVSKSYRVFVQC
jgi:hypothetical protein